jgi:hypothetical protein
MDRNDQQAIEGLFTKLATVEQQAGPRDADSERFIRDRIDAQPGAPYFMAQTILVQEQALAAAKERIEQLERQGSTPQYESGAAQPERGGVLSNMFGNSSAPQSGSVPTAGRPSPWGGGQLAQDMPPQRRGGGGGFLAGAAQTAMGVAGGMFLGNALMGMFGGDEAKASEPAAEPAAEPAQAPADEGIDLGFDDTEF